MRKNGDSRYDFLRNYGTVNEYEQVGIQITPSNKQRRFKYFFQKNVISDFWSLEMA